MISEAANESVLQIICSAAAQKLKIDMMPGKSYIILQHIYNFCQQACKRGRGQNFQKFLKGVVHSKFS